MWADRTEATVRFILCIRFFPNHFVLGPPFLHPWADSSKTDENQGCGGVRPCLATEVLEHPTSFRAAFHGQWATFPPWISRFSKLTKLFRGRKWTVVLNDTPHGKHFCGNFIHVFFPPRLHPTRPLNLLKR